MSDVPTAPSPTGRIDLLSWLYADEQMEAVFSVERSVELWLAVEAALARAQVAVGMVDADDAAAIADAVDRADVDVAALRHATQVVGYPILPVVRHLAGSLPAGPDGRVHLGATTQDVMDTALALQLQAALLRLISLVDAVDAELARLVREHRTTVMAGRTHAMQAVPTTFGAKLAVNLDELLRLRADLARLLHEVPAVSAYGAGGTSAASWPHGPAVRAALAKSLGLPLRHVPWHVARGGLSDVAHAAARAATACARLAREVVELGRTEIAEVREAGGHHRGASSTMPQKANPITSEAVIGFAVVAQSLAAGTYRALEIGHERAAGEWQAEWYLVPHVAVASASALALTTSLLAGLHVDADAMRANLELANGSIMAEALMMALAPRLGRERAHDVVYEAVRSAACSGRSLHDELQLMGHAPDGPVAPSDYLGEALAVCDRVLDAHDRVIVSGGAA